jgi:hypothetical protein
LEEMWSRDGPGGGAEKDESPAGGRSRANNREVNRRKGSSEMDDEDYADTFRDIVCLGRGPRHRYARRTLLQWGVHVA